MLTNSQKVQDELGIFIIIPVHNRKNITLACLEQLAAQGNAYSFQVIVIDDGSTDGTSDAIQAIYPHVHLIRGDGNLWWTGAIAQGMQLALQLGALYVIWLNDDCLVPPETLDNLIDLSARYCNAIVGAQGYVRGHPTQVAFGGKRRKIPHYQLFNCPQGEVAPCDMLSGNLVCIPRQVIDTVGLPNRILPHYGGDTLYLMQARQAGFKLFVDARTFPYDTPGDSAVYPSSWLLKKGRALDIIKLIFQPQSMLSWWVWWVLLTEDYGPLGVLIFLGKYLYMLPKLVVITGLRLLPLSTRQVIINLKCQLLCISSQ